jgi:tetratricopeptide (TPR) repeat protein
MRSILHQLYPQGIDSTVQRQLNRLPEQMHPLLTAAAVAGRVIDPALLRQLIGQLDASFSYNDWLIQCISAAILEIDQGQARFANETLRMTLLDMLSESQKLSWHEQIVAALEAIYPNEPAQAATLAYHWQQLGQTRKEQQYARLAGAFAFKQNDLETAVRHFSRAITLTPADDLTEQYDLLLDREHVYHVQGDRDAQKDDLTRLAEIADQLSSESNQAQRMEVALRLGAFAQVTGEYTVAIVAATEALRLAVAAQVPAYEAGSNLLWGQALQRQGKYEEAQEKLQSSRTQAVTHKLPQLTADSLRFLGVGATDLGQFDQAKLYYEEALLLYRDLEDKRGESTVLNNLSIVAYAKNQLVNAMTHWEQARLIHQAIGDKEGTARVLTNLSSVCLDLGEYEKGLAYSQEALAICREIDLRFGQGMNLINLSIFKFHLGHHEQAEIFSQAALELARKMKSMPLEGLALKDLAYILAQRQQWAVAEATYQQALTIWQELSQPLYVLEMQAGLAKVALGRNDLAQAQNYIQPLVAHLQSAHSFAGTSRPFFIYLVCHNVLAAAGDPFATTVLQHAHEALMLFANEIADASQRDGFFQNVTEHQQITMLFKQDS